MWRYGWISYINLEERWWKKNRTLLFPYNSFFHTYRKEVNLYTSESIIFGIQHWKLQRNTPTFFEINGIGNLFSKMNISRFWEICIQGKYAYLREICIPKGNFSFIPTTFFLLIPSDIKFECNHVNNTYLKVLLIVHSIADLSVLI